VTGIVLCVLCVLRVCVCVCVCVVDVSVCIGVLAYVGAAFKVTEVHAPPTASVLAPWTVRVRVDNVGTRDGEEVVFVFRHYDSPAPYGKVTASPRTPHLPCIYATQLHMPCIITIVYSFGTLPDEQVKQLLGFKRVFVPASGVTTYGG